MISRLSKILMCQEERFIVFLRWMLAVVFIWFGLLKIAGFNPVYDLIYHSLAPVLAEGTGLIALGIFETAIGFLLLFNRVVILTHLLLVFHLLGTFSTFLFGWQVMFDPYFPVLSLPGEFVVKNFTLVAAGLVVLAHESKNHC